MDITYKTTIVQKGNTTGLHVPEDILERLGGGKRPLIRVHLNGYSYRSAVGKMDGKFMIPLSAENRTKAGVNGGDTVEVSLALDTLPRTVEVPPGLKSALDKNKTAKLAFEKLAPSRKKAIVLSIGGAKTEETKTRRIEKAIKDLLKPA